MLLIMRLQSVRLSHVHPMGKTVRFTGAWLVIKHQQETPRWKSNSAGIVATDLYKYSPDAVPPIHVVSYHVATDKPPPPPKMATCSGLFLATIYNQSQLAERKHVARHWSINSAATAVPLSAHPSLLVREISGGHIGRGVVRRRCSAGPCSTAPVSLLTRKWKCLIYTSLFTIAGSK